MSQASSPLVERTTITRATSLASFCMPCCVSPESTLQRLSASNLPCLWLKLHSLHGTQVRALQRALLESHRECQECYEDGESELREQCSELNQYAATYKRLLKTAQSLVRTGVHSEGAELILACKGPWFEVGIPCHAQELSLGSKGAFAEPDSRSHALQKQVTGFRKVHRLGCWDISVPLGLGECKASCSLGMIF